MAPPKKEKISKDEAKRLFEFYQKVELDITQKLNKALLKGNSTAYLDGMLSGVQKTLKELRLANKAWCEQAIPHVYTEGLYSADIMVEGLGIAAKSGFGGMHQQAAQVLAENTYNRLEDVTKVIGRQAEDIYRSLALEQIRGSTIGYATWKEVAKNYRERLAENGVTGFTDRSGRKWNMSSYAQMVARTSTMEAHLQGTTNRLLEQGFDLIKVSHHATACELCVPWEGKILSLTGKTPDFPTLEEARAAGLFHPNCRHAYGLYIDLDKELESSEKITDVENYSKFVNVDYQEDYKEELMPIYEKFAKKRGLTLAEYEKEATDKLEKLIKNADIQVNVKPETLLNIVNNGSFKTLSELGTASGRTEKYIANRVKIEKMIFDQNDGKIIYGTLQDKTLREIPTEGLTGYGDIKIILNKDKLGDVTTFTGCDSSFAFSTGVSSFKKPSIYFQSTLDVDKVQDILDSSVTHINHLGADRRFYIEAQVHKKVLLEEIEEVVFKDKQSLSKELADALDKNKIKYRVANEYIGGVDLSRYDQQHKDAAFWFKGRYGADKELRKQTGELWKTLSAEEREALYEYTSGSGKFNRPLRGYEGSWQNYKGIGQVDLDYEGGKAMIEAATKALDRCSYDFDIWLQRGVETSDGAAGFLGIKTSELALSEKELQDLLIDKVVKDEAFLSTSACKGSGFSGELIVNLYAPRGTKMIYAEPFSYCGRGAKLAWDGEAKQSNFGNEFEVILQRGSSYKITKVEKVGGQIYIDVDVFPPEL